MSPLDDPGSSSSSDEDHSLITQAETRPRGFQPWGFKELRFRIDNFSGKDGSDDFEALVEDYKEVTAYCGWTDDQRAWWFSWFLSGPAKVTWQRSLKNTDKASWDRTVEIYCGQYGIHLDPRTAYQQCQELHHEMFGSAQGLLDAMRDYQHMAPRKLTDETLESILWNEVPVELQKEVKEITDGSVQELLHKLLRAEAVLQERARWSTQQTSKRYLVVAGVKPQSYSNPDVELVPHKKQQQDTNYSREMSMQRVKCFNCHQ